jgi:hypothetical protein
MADQGGLKTLTAPDTADVGDADRFAACPGPPDCSWPGASGIRPHPATTISSVVIIAAMIMGVERGARRSVGVTAVT